MTVKNIFVFLDGTTNGFATTTNVIRLYRILKAHDPKGPIFYDQGIATEFTLNIWEFIRNLVTSGDIFRKLQKAYRYICEQYVPGAKVWLFGFSRGAYTARAIAELINRVGIIKVNYDGTKISNDCWEKYSMVAYRYFYSTKAQYGYASEQFFNDHSYSDSRTSIFFLGLWDTVGAIGVPNIVTGYGPEFTHLLSYQYVDPSINYGYHALSTHEDMSMFEPIHLLPASAKLAEVVDSNSVGSKESNQVIEERFFPGYHLDVGGFVGAQPIANASLNWIVEKINGTKALPFEVIFKPDDGSAVEKLLNGIVGFVYVLGRLAYTYFVRGLFKAISNFIIRERSIPGRDKKVLLEVWTTYA